MRLYAATTAIILGLSWANAQAVVAPIVDLNDLPEDAASSSSQNPSADSSADTRQTLPMDQRVRLLEQQISNLTQMNLPAKVDDLTQQIHELNGQLEEQTHTIQQLQEQLQKPPVSASDVTAPATTPTVTTTKVTTTAAKKTTTANKKEAAATATDDITLSETAIVQNKAVAATTTKDDGAAEKSYLAAFDLMVKKQNAAAITAFNSFIKNYPNNTAFAPSAHYWLGELYSTTSGKSAQASREFTWVIQQAPHHAKVPDAMLKLAIIHDDAGQHAQAKQELQKVIAQFPTSVAAKLAKMRLASMKSV